MKRPVMIVTGLALLWLTTTASSCASTGGPTIEVREVKIPVPVACPDKRDPPPTYVDTVAAIKALAGKPDALVALLLGGRDQRIARETANEGQIASCKPPP